MDGAGALDGRASDGNVAEEVVADVVRVGVDEVLRDAVEAGEGSDERGGVGGGVDGEEGRGDGGGVVDGPGESQGAVLGGVERRDDGGLEDGVADAVGGGEDVEGDVAAGADVDVLDLMTALNRGRRSHKTPRPLWPRSPLNLWWRPLLGQRKPGRRRRSW